MSITLSTREVEQLMSIMKLEDAWVSIEQLSMYITYHGGQKPEAPQ